MQHKTINYTINYLTSDGKKRGQEICTLTSHIDGHKTIRARSEIFDSEVLRDIIYSVDHKFKPLDALIRVSVRDEFVGAGWFRFSEYHAECESYTKDSGRTSQRIDLPGRATSFITHAVSTDVWHGASIKKAPATEAQNINPLLSSSPLHNGSSGPSLGHWPLKAYFIGEEAVETPAGKFKAEHIRYEEINGELFLDTWCTADENRIMLKMYYPPYNSSYILSSIEYI